MSEIYRSLRNSALRKSVVGLRRRLRDGALRPLVFHPAADAYALLHRGPPALHRVHRAEMVNAPGRWLAIDGASQQGEVRRYRGTLRLETRTGLIWRAGRPIAQSDDGLGTPKMPGIVRMWRARPRPVDACVSFLHMNAANYYHALTFVLPRLDLLDAAGIDRALPIVISETLARQPYFKSLVEMKFFAGRALLAVGEHEAVATNEVIVVRPEGGTRRDYDAVLDRLGVAARPAGDRRLFVRRGAGAANKRFIRNEAALMGALARFGFEPLDPQTLDLGGQIAAFAAAGVVVSQHGAGLTNIIFRRGAPLHVIELFNPAVLHAGYLNISGEYGYRYCPFLNLNSDGSWSGPSDADLPAIEAYIAATLPR